MPDLISMSSQALQSQSLRIRLGTIALLSETRDPRAVPYLIQRLDDADFTVRIEAAKSLGLLGDRSASAHLLNRLKTEEVLEVRTSITKALYQLKY